MPLSLILQIYLGGKFMQTTGIVRRIDDLGRIVVPKEIRRTLKFNEGDELEIFVTNDSLVLRRFSEVQNLSKMAKEILEIFSKFTGADMILCDMHDVALAEGKVRKQVLDKPISNALEKVLKKRKIEILSGENSIHLLENGEEFECKNQIIAPIIYHGDLIGGLVFLTDTLKENILEIANLAVSMILTITTK